MLETILVQEQRLEMHQAGDRARQRLDQVITEYESVEIIEQPDGVRDLRDQVSAEREELQAAGRIRRNWLMFEELRINRRIG